MGEHNLVTADYLEEVDDHNGDNDTDDDGDDLAHRCTIFLCIWDGKYSTGW